jgi:serine/threonine protein kinase/tetratricopeptide (TPR) repeat protein
MIPCPPRETWQHYVDERLDAAEDRLLTEHVRECRACEETLAGLVPPCLPPRASGSAPPLPPAELVERLGRMWSARFPADDLTAPEYWPRIDGYEILGVLGRGGMGVVYRARERALGREVAMKMIAAGEQSSAADVRRLLNDATTAAGLRHEGIVSVYAVGQYRGKPYCVMELVAGGSLAQRAADLVNEPRQAARLIAAAARALHHAHLHGVCHRDVKPANILLRVRCAEREASPLGPDVVPPRARLCDLDSCVTDFGLAKSSRADTSLTPDGVVVGTPGYVAPEQIRAEKPAPAADVYGLGAVLYECVTGQPPCRAATPFDTLLLTLHREPERPRPLNSRLSRDLETICLKCLQKEPGKRYASAADLADDLGRYLREEPIVARPVGSLERSWRWCRRNPVIAGLAASVVLAVAVGLAASLALWQQAAHSEARALAGEAEARANLQKEEVARREAEAGYAQVQQLLSEALKPSLGFTLRMNPSQELPDLDALRSAEDRCARLLAHRPGDTGVRITLTNVRGNLGSLYALWGQLPEMEACYQRAQELWEADPRNPNYRNCMATIYCWQSGAARLQGDSERWLRLVQRAYALCQEVAEEQPSNRTLLQSVAVLRVELLRPTDPGTGREAFLRPLEEEKALLGKLVGADPASTALRKRLALTCLALGEVHLGQRRMGEALPYWRQACEQYRILARQQPEDPLVQLNLALCCSRLMTGQPTDPYYGEAVAQFERAASRLTALVQQDPDSDWLQPTLLETYCSLTVCHWIAGQPALAEQTFQQRLWPLAAQVGEHGADQKRGLAGLYDLLRIAELLQEEKPAAALAILREAAALAERYADAPVRGLEFCDHLGNFSVNTSAFLCRLGEPSEALRQAEQARRLFGGLHSAAPDVPRYGNGLCQAWERIAKARWAMGRRDEALAAFREAAAVQRQVVRQAPTVPFYRVSLSRCYARLAYWSGLSGDRAGAAAALREREKLWPNEPKQLLEVSGDFQKLAEAVGQGREQLSPEELAERQGYLAESERAQRAAEAVRDAATKGPPR